MRLTNRMTLYCTDTGRPLLTLTEFGPMNSRIDQPTSMAKGFWSADSRQFWMAMDVDGKLSGYDFRPREVAK